MGNKTVYLDRKEEIVLDTSILTNFKLLFSSTFFQWEKDKVTLM